jgi:molybdenum cofactor cytidylyltransferase
MLRPILAHTAPMIPALVLAAGKSTRMGRLKATLPVDAANPAGDTFLTRILRTFQAADVDDLVVVVGCEADAVVESVVSRGFSPRFVNNRDYESGQLSSLLAGLRAIDRPGVNAMLLMLVDAPLVAPGTVRLVVERYRATGASIVRPVDRADDSRHGHPVLVDRKLFDALRAADPATGAKPVVRAHVSAEGNVDVDDEGAFADVDTPEDYERLSTRT